MTGPRRLPRAAGLLLAGACLASEPSFGQNDEALNLLGRVAPSIAQLNLSGFAARTRCTGVQLGRRAALAFSFCLQGGRIDQAHLLFGHDREERGERRAVLAAFNDPKQALLKLLCLDARLGPSRFKPRGLPVSEGEPVIVAGYTAAKPETLTSRNCNVLRTVRENEFNLDCDAGPGSAGSAVLRREKEEAALLGILVAPSPTGSLVLAWNGGDPDDLCANP